jgi:hypothetical protein
MAEAGFVVFRTIPLQIGRQSQCKPGNETGHHDTKFICFYPHLSSSMYTLALVMYGAMK